MKWDKGVDFETMLNLLLRHMHLKSTSRIGRCYDSILLIQLRNGSRISEAVRAYKEFIRTKKNEINVAVSKKKKPETRLMIIPSEVVVCEELLLEEDKKIINRIQSYIRHTYKINTHSLRYSFITYLLRAGVNPSIVAKITKHSRLDYILTYTQTKVAEDVLKSIKV